MRERRNYNFNDIRIMNPLIKLSLLCFLILTGFLNKAFAQDIIHTSDRGEIKAKILEINDFEIVYKSFDYLDGPDYKISLKRVLSVDFENGTKRSFTQWPRSFEPDYFYDGYMDYRHGGYYCRNRRLAGDALIDYFGLSIYGSVYIRARNRYSWGMWLTVAGASCLAMGILVNISSADMSRAVNRSRAEMPRVPSWNNTNSSFSDQSYYVPLYVAGAAFLGAGIPLWSKGGRELRKLADDYNARYMKPGISRNSSLMLGVTSGGFGLALNF